MLDAWIIERIKKEKEEEEKKQWEPIPLPLEEYPREPVKREKKQEQNRGVVVFELQGCKDSETLIL
ncbi:hypothetical protein L0222_18460 [bacterium]|nr:hypothetical protein [bacterium]MCI0602651.1 hypothetical protein [bacterium]